MDRWALFVAVLALGFTAYSFFGQHGLQQRLAAIEEDRRRKEVASSPMSAAGDTLLVPVGLGAQPMVLALVLGATGMIPTATPSAAPTTSASPSPSGNSELQISTPNQSDGILFDTKQLTAAAGARVGLTYTNESAIPHDWHLFDGPNASAPSIVSTKVEAGPNDVQHVSFTVLSNPGRYYFQCDAHPSLMNGFLIAS